MCPDPGVTFRTIETVAAILDEARPVLLRMTLLSYGKVAALQRSRGGEPSTVFPSGESEPLAESYAAAFAQAQTVDQARALLDEARAELSTWLRRPLAPDTTETLDELMARIVQDGWALTPDDCARAMRCLPSLVRRARIAAGRHPETGQHLPTVLLDRMAWARVLDSAGLSLRQIEVLTGVPKSTLHYRLSKAA